MKALPLFIAALFTCVSAFAAESTRSVYVGACKGMPHGGAALTDISKQDGELLSFEIDSKGNLLLPTPSLDGWEYAAEGETGHRLKYDLTFIPLNIACHD